MIESKHPKGQGIAIPPGPNPKHIALEAQGTSGRLHTIKSGNNANGSQVSWASSTELHLAIAHREVDRNEDQRLHGEEQEIKEEFE